MTDWLDDLEALFKFYHNLKSLSANEASKLRMGFLVHVLRAVSGNSAGVE